MGTSPLREQIVDGTAEAIRQAREQLFAFGRRSPVRVAEHAVSADRTHPLLAQQRQDFGDGSGITARRGVGCFGEPNAR